MFSITHVLRMSSLKNTPKVIDHTHIKYIACLLQDLQKRHFFGSFSKKKEYHGRKLVGYSSEQMYSVVVDVGNYKKFVPFCKRSDLIVEESDYLLANLEIGFPPLVESYTSNVTFKKPLLVNAICTDGKLFNYLETMWIFNRGLRSNPQTCIIDFSIDFEFKTVLHSQLAHMFFDMLVVQMEEAFITEAKRRYGKESLPTHSLESVRS